MPFHIVMFSVLFRLQPSSRQRPATGRLHQRIAYASKIGTLSPTSKYFTKKMSIRCNFVRAVTPRQPTSSQSRPVRKARTGGGGGVREVEPGMLSKEEYQNPMRAAHRRIRTSSICGKSGEGSGCARNERAKSVSLSCSFSSQAPNRPQMDACGWFLLLLGTQK